MPQSTDVNVLVIDQTEQQPDWQRFEPTIRKIVLGNCPTDGDAASATISLPADLATPFAKLTHLYLWKIDSLESLPELPSRLVCLDVRGCENLTGLPDLPATLETLDIGGCSKLADLPNVELPQLKRFYFNDCPALKPFKLESMLDGLVQHNAPVVEIDGSGTAAVRSLDVFPKSLLRKLVLRKCDQLTDVDRLTDFEQLEHLDLQDCTGVSRLVDIPPALEYLALHGAERLKMFCGQSIGPFDRGLESGQNVAPIFHTRRKFGDRLAVLPHAKLLLMGDGRVGKSTLAKRLQWEELDDAAKASDVGQCLKPSYNEPYTHKVQFKRWETGLALDDSRLQQLRDGADARQMTLPLNEHGLLDGAIRIWDFGGQDLYHSTHRIFASEGSIFLLVWCADQTDPGPPPSDLSQDIWQAWNRQRSLDYWLEYIFSMRGQDQAQVALVCTHCGTDVPRPHWKDHAPRHEHLDLPCFHIDSMDDDCGDRPEYQQLVQWIRQACGSEADRIGILQPSFFRDVSNQVDNWVEANSSDRNHGRPAQHLLMDWADWHDAIAAAHADGQNEPAIELMASDVAAITDYLHDAGHLFQIRHPQDRAVLVDQGWAADLIYHLLNPLGEFRQHVVRNGGWFYRRELEDDVHWKALQNDAQRERLLQYMEDCRVITRIGGPRSGRSGDDIYLAADKWLLPPYDGSLEATVDQRMKQVGEQAGMEIKTFAFDDRPINEFDFRQLQSHLAQFFSTWAVYFRDGLQATEPTESPAWCLRIHWQAEQDDAFYGKLKVLLAAQREQMDDAFAQVQNLLFADEMLRLQEHAKSSEPQRGDRMDLTHAFFRPLREDEYDVAVSSTGADREQAAQIVRALQDAGLLVYWYRLEECRSNERGQVMEFMKNLCRPACTILLLSEAYLQNDPQERWYCPWELADAMHQVRLGKRTIDQTLVVFRESDAFHFSQVDETVNTLFEAMRDYFHHADRSLNFDEVKQFAHYREFVQHFNDARSDEVWKPFFKARGAHGEAISFDHDLPTNDRGEKDFGRIVQAVRKALA